MTTEAQINANRENAEKSTGPRTAEGKAVVSQNAVKHGLFADATVVNGESQAEYDLCRDTFLAEIRPVGAIESMLVERFVSLSWRLRRAERMQSEAIDNLIIHAADSDKITRSMLSGGARQMLADSETLERDLSLGLAAVNDFSSYRALDRMMLYERRLESSMIRTMKEIKRLNILRRIERENEVEQQSAPQMSPPADDSGRLKIQTQLGREIVELNDFMGKCYEKIARLESAESKANLGGAPGSAGATEQFSLPPGQGFADRRK